MGKVEKKNISFFFPAFNDEDTVQKLVEDAIDVLESVSNDYEIIIVDDGSVDNTGKVADEMAKKYSKVKVVHHLYNIGYGAALKTGFATSKYELIFYTDGDHQFDPRELEKLLPWIDEYDIVSGYRVDRADSRTRKIASKLYNLIIHLLFRIRFKDVDCAFKLLKREVVQTSGQYTNNGAFICAELFFRAIRQGYRIKQLPVHHYAREYGKSTSFSLFFILRSIIELAETLWYLDWRDKYYAFRRDLQRKLLLRRQRKH